MVKENTLIQTTEFLPAAVVSLSASNARLEQTFPIGKLLRIERYGLLGENPHSEERGVLLCLPVSDDAFGLELAYVLEGAERDEVICLHVHPDFLSQWSVDMLNQEAAFRFDHTAEHELRLDAPSAALLKSLVGLPQEGLASSLQSMEYVLQLLRRAMEQLSHPFAPCPVPVPPLP